MGAINLSNKNVLVTGGTSGLGYALVKQCAEKGCSVVATGRNLAGKTLQEGKSRFFPVDFRNLSDVARFGRIITEEQQPFDIVFCNAGILSPPEFSLTPDGNETTFQVNFLSHLLLTQIIISERPEENSPLILVPITSPIFRFGRINTLQTLSQNNYSRFKAYAGSKLYLALMTRFFNEKYKDKGIHSFSFDPGIFSSGIYRTQKKWFHRAYHLASPVMKDPSSVASVLINLLETENLAWGVIYNRKGTIAQLPENDQDPEAAFWNDCLEKISPFK